MFKHVASRRPPPFSFKPLKCVECFKRLQQSSDSLLSPSGLNALNVLNVLNGWDLNM